MTLLVRDEQDVLRANIAFHLAHGVDEIILMDNQSVDGTAAIAHEFVRAGRLHYVFQQHDDYAQGRWVTAMARHATHHLGADWVINADADEFWWPHGGSLKEILAGFSPGTLAVRAERANFVARVPNGEPFWRRMNVRAVSPVNALGDALSGKVAHRGSTEVVVEQGNHAVSFAGAPIFPVPAPITILHFPIRSRAQYLNKIVKGGAAYARNRELDFSVGQTWRHVYRMHLEGRFDEAYVDALFTEDKIAAGLASGALVPDERLISALATRGATLVA